MGSMISSDWVRAEPVEYNVRAALTFFLIHVILATCLTSVSKHSILFSILITD